MRELGKGGEEREEQKTARKIGRECRVERKEKDERKGKLTTENKWETDGKREKGRGNKKR